MRLFNKKFEFTKLLHSLLLTTKANYVINYHMRAAHNYIWSPISKVTSSLCEMNESYFLIIKMQNQSYELK